MNTAQTEAAIAILRDLATRLEKGEVEAGKIQIQLREAGTTYDDRYVESVEIEVRKVIPKKDC